MWRFVASVLLAAILAATPVSGQDRQGDIRGVITGQIEAFGVDDFATAFGFASPMIRNMFRTPENFGQMVMQGYPMVWRPSDVRYGELIEENGRILQRVFLRDLNGNGFVATYEMLKGENGWQINGVRIEPQVDVGA
jgi:Domain of unknown function (DUF4864)